MRSDYRLLFCNLNYSNEVEGLSMNCSRSIALFLILLVVTVARAEENQFFCVAEEVVGFAYSPTKGWHGSNFDSGDKKFVIRKLQKDELGFSEDKVMYGFFELGADSTLDLCEIQHGGLISCRSFMGEAIFEPGSGRFIRTYTFGYWLGGNEESDTPYIMRGRCSKI
ncbi:hypothetical protein [Marinobacter sp. ST-43]|uniref:hypothetical protein n=1 Tax=Marinobacter sp. ST-43 TaxID=3050453 RepID=UPI0026DFC4E8|nr:hypothetical protein [Marinobacter sp. ST-43]